MLTYQIEPFSSLWPEALPVMERHWEEVGADKERARFRFDAEAFAFLDARGALQVLICRSAGEIVGYSIVIIRQHTHYDLLCGFEDAYYLAPQFRKGMAGVRLIRETLKGLRCRGVEKVFFHSKTVKPLGRIFSRLGFVKSDEIWSLWLRGK